VARQRLDSLTQTLNHPDPSVRNRYELWKAAFGMWEDHPLTGVGPKAFPDYKNKYAGLAFSDKSAVGGAGSKYQVVQLLTPHSLYLLLLAELGIFGFIAFLGLVLALLGGSAHAVRAGPRDRLVMSFAMFTFAAMVVYAMTNIYGDLGGPSTLLEQVLVGCAVWTAAHSPAHHHVVDDDDDGYDDENEYELEPVDAD
jgi:O-antigen ligase